MSRHDNPGHGNMGEVNGFAINQSSRVTKSNDLASRLGALVSSPEATEWTSNAGTAWRERVTRVVPSASASADVAQRWHDAAVTYKDVVALIATQGTRAYSKIDTARHMIYSYSHVPAEVGGIQAKIDEFEEDINEANRLLWSLNTQRTNADSAFAAALNYHAALNETRDWTALQDIYGGVTTLKDLDVARAALVTEYSELVRRQPPAADAELDRLAKFLTTSASDPALAADFWELLGADEVFMVLDLVGNRANGNITQWDVGKWDNVDEAGSLAASIRASFAAATTQWDQETSRTFAEELWSDDLSAQQRIGFLFSAPGEDPVSLNFTLAMADVIDWNERFVEDQPDPYVGGISSHTGVPYVDGTGLVLEHITPGGLGDALGPVFGTLALYPDASWAWLTSDEPAMAGGTAALEGSENRIDYYSSRRYIHDGWAGFGAVWESSMHAEGGIASGATGGPTWDAQCDAAARIINGLDVGMSDLRPGNLSAGGGESLGAALANLMPMAAASLTSQGSQLPEGALLDSNRHVAGFDSTMTIPYFNHDNLGDLIGQVGSTDSGFASLRVAVSEVQSRYLNAAQASSDLGGWDKALQEVYKLEANFDGAVGGASIVQGQFDDAVIKQKIAVMSELVGLIPGARVEGVGGVAIGAFDGQARGGILDAFESAVVNNESWALRLSDVDALCGRALLDSQLARLEHDPNLSFGAYLASLDANPTLLDGNSTEFKDGLGTDYLAYENARRWGATHDVTP